MFGSKKKGSLENSYVIQRYKIHKFCNICIWIARVPFFTVRVCVCAHKIYIHFVVLFCNDDIYTSLLLFCVCSVLCTSLVHDMFVGDSAAISCPIFPCVRSIQFTNSTRITYSSTIFTTTLVNSSSYADIKQIQWVPISQYLKFFERACTHIFKRSRLWCEKMIVIGEIGGMKGLREPTPCEGVYAVVTHLLLSVVACFVYSADSKIVESGSICIRFRQFFLCWLRYRVFLNRIRATATFRK